MNPINNTKYYTILSETKKINEEKNKSENEHEYKKRTNHKYIKNPNFKSYSDIIKTNYPYGDNNSFEIYTSYKDNKLYIASPRDNSNYLDIFSLIDNKRIISLKHQRDIQGVKYFFNKKNNNEYLVASNYDVIYIRDISNNYKLMYEINILHGNCLLIFLENNNDYIVASSKMHSFSIDESTRIYSFSNCSLVRYIDNTKHEQIEYLIYWYNQKDNKNYFIQLAHGKILINNLLENELYAELVNNEYSFHSTGFIYNKNNIDYLGVSANDGSDNGLIEIWDLYNKNLFKVFKGVGSNITCVMRWNYKYFLICDWKNKCLKIFDLENEKVISNIKEKNCIRCVKKVYHPIYGESLLTSDEKNKIKLWVI